MEFTRNRFLIAVFAMAVIVPACRKTAQQPVANPVNFTDTAGTLKSAAAFPLGMAIDYALMLNDAIYAATVKREANSVTFGYQMKHGAIVQSDGSFDFTKADQLVNMAVSAGLSVYGHTLAWHQNNNGDYLRSLAYANGTGGAAVVLNNGDFEAGTTSFPGWSRLAGGTASAVFEVETAPENVEQGTRSFKVTVNTPGANAYDVQALNSPDWTAVAGKQYTIKLFAKSAAGGTIRMVNQNVAYHQNNITVGTTWTEYTWNFTAGETAYQFALQFPVTGIYWVDNIRISEAGTVPLSFDETAINMDSALSRFIRASVTRYAGTVKAWDVVNEPMMDGASGLRTNTGTTNGDIFYWSQYLGRDYALKAFRYAKAAGPGALIFINEYNLESNNAKLDSLLAYVNELKNKGAVIDGIGTQMHISINTPTAGIDNMFVKLAATGMKIRVSELDIRINPGDLANYMPTAQDLGNQAAMYRYVVNDYIKYIPAAQRYGITVWGVTDKDSWINTSQGKRDFPLLFDSLYAKKPAYAGILQALKSK
jgi:endo-1,4-beta-xylanase